MLSAADCLRRRSANVSHVSRMCFPCRRVSSSHFVAPFAFSPFPPSLPIFHWLVSVTAAWFPLHGGSWLGGADFQPWGRNSRGWLPKVEAPGSLHENLVLTNFDSHQKCIKVGPLSLTHESKVLEHFWDWLWDNFDSRQSYQAFDPSQRWAKVPLMHALEIFDKTFDHFWFQSKVYYSWLKSKMAFDSCQKWSKVWSNMAFNTFDICQRCGAKAIFPAVDIPGTQPPF